jgi:hypothetical protein
MTDNDYADTHAKLTEIAVLSLGVENLVAYIDRVRSAPAADSADHVDLALAIATVQQIAHRLLG